VLRGSGESCRKVEVSCAESRAQVTQSDSNLPVVKFAENFSDVILAGLSYATGHVIPM